MALNTHIAQTAVDFQGLAELRRSVAKDGNDQETLRQVAGQFESLFLNMMLKSMRKASLAEGIFDTSQSKMYQEMSDQQLAINLSSRGGLGLQEVIMRQLGGKTPETDSHKISPTSLLRDRVNIVPKPVSKPEVIPASDLIQKVIAAAPAKSLSESKEIKFHSSESFVEQLWPMAKKAADRLGVKPEVILSQAALETGWGKHIITHQDGKSSHNLFNIKADKRWDGDHAAVGTVEYRGGVAVKEQAQFRSYDNYQQSFDDYVNFLQTQPRYRQALEHTDNPERFVEELHKAGYATDPAYAEKVKRIMHGSTLAQISQQHGYS
jgi:peptidoglycan hydrolase FlgJ